MRSVRVRTNDMTGNILESYGDPISLVRMPVVVSGSLDGAEIRCSIVIGGVTFMDGTTSNSFWAKDLDEIGIGSLLFLKANSAHSNCRTFSVWKDGVRLAIFN